MKDRKGNDYSLFTDGVDVNDVRQGALGDCYFLSALTVLRNEDVRDKFYTIDNTEEWRECGAFCVRFYDEGKEDFVIIDDNFVINHG